MSSPEDAKNRRRVGGTPAESPTFLPEGAFVVQFTTGTTRLDGPVAGRVEHVVSGQAAHFKSLAELLAFLREVLRLPPAEIPEMQGNTDHTDLRDRPRLR